MTGLKAETILWPVYIDYEYEDWTYGTAIEEYGEQAKAVGVNVFLVNSILR